MDYLREVDRAGRGEVDDEVDRLREFLAAR